MSNPNPQAPAPRTGLAWWQVPHVLFVVILLLLGITATSTMVVISAQDQDPVLDKEVYERELRAAQAKAGRTQEEALLAVQPANQGRNHAATPDHPPGR